MNDTAIENELHVATIELVTQVVSQDTESLDFPYLLVNERYCNPTGTNSCAPDKKQSCRPDPGD